MWSLKQNFLFREVKTWGLFFTCQWIQLQCCADMWIFPKQISTQLVLGSPMIVRVKWNTTLEPICIIISPLQFQCSGFAMLVDWNKLEEEEESLYEINKLKLCMHPSQLPSPASMCLCSEQRWTRSTTLPAQPGMHGIDPNFQLIRPRFRRTNWPLGSDQWTIVGLMGGQTSGPFSCNLSHCLSHSHSLVSKTWTWTTHLLILQLILLVPCVNDLPNHQLHWPSSQYSECGIGRRMVKNFIQNRLSLRCWHCLELSMKISNYSGVRQVMQMFCILLRMLTI